MTRGGRRKERDGPERRCIASGESGPTERLIRFVLDPDGRVTPDLTGRLPGRGAWLTADRALVDRAVGKNLFARAFRRAVPRPEGLADLLEELLVRRLIEVIGLARRAGQAVTGFEKTRARIEAGRSGVLLEASDAAEDGKRKLAGLARGVPRIDCLDRGELGLAFGRDFAIHAALDAGGFADRALAEARRLEGLRRPAEDAKHARATAAHDHERQGEPNHGSGQDG